MSRGPEQRNRLAEEAQPLTVRLPQDEYQALRTYAFVTRISMNEVIRKAVLAYLASEGRQEEMNAIIEQVREAHRVSLDKLAEM